MNFLEKLVVANKIKNITYDDMIVDFVKLQSYEYTGSKSLIGTKCVDYFTFINRLDTIGNKGINFWEFFIHLEEYKKKPYINNFMINNENAYPHIKLLFNTFKLYYGNIGSFYSSTTSGIIDEFKPTCIIDPFAGFGGRLVGAMSRNTPYMGWDTNLDINYLSIIMTLMPLTKSKERMWSVYNEPAQFVDYSKYNYDMVLTSPPYYNIELYNGTDKKTKKEWNALYNTVFKNAYDNMANGGKFILSINNEMYENVLVPLLGECSDCIPYVKSRRGKYTEMLYIWIK